MNRSYYSASVAQFLSEPADSVLGSLTRSHAFTLAESQRNAWVSQIQFLAHKLGQFGDGHIIFEYSIPRMGKRVDNILIVGNLVFVIEFKVGADAYHRHDIDQVLDYSLDLKNFHAASSNVPLIPVLIATNAQPFQNELGKYADDVWVPIRATSDTFENWIGEVIANSAGIPVNAGEWEMSEYRPTPSIVEAAQVLYQGHGVEEISRSEAANLGATTNALVEIVERAKVESSKVICFVTGVPGSGKTLAGLNLASSRQRVHEDEHAVFLSGNGPLVQVLQEALARSEVTASHGKTTKAEALSRTKSFIQIIHHFRDEGLISEDPPIERLAVFDEAQRAWTMEQTRRFMSQKKGVDGFSKSEPEFLIEIMDRHQGWAAIICLIGGGQEINTGEAGLPEWFEVLGAKFNRWKVHVSDRLTDYEYDRGSDIYGAIAKENLITDRRLHLATSIRSFRSEHVAMFVKALLDLDQDLASVNLRELEGRYPIFLTRDLEIAKDWIRRTARGTERFGLVASSGAYRLRPFGITVRAKIDPRYWFLNDADDVRSSYYLEEVATEFDIQGLELDWTVVAWDADLRYVDNSWRYMSFRGTKWTSVNDETRKLYLKNAYRVLLTRARQGMIIFIPPGDPDDKTRIPEYYDRTYRYLRRIGIEEIR